MTQTAVDDPAPIGIPGQLADAWTESEGDVGSGVIEEAGGIPFGILTKKGTNAGQVKLPTTAADILEGILVHADEYEVTTQLAAVTVNTYPQSAVVVDTPVGLLKKGRILVIPEATGTEASGVHARIVASGGNTQLGSFTPTAEVGKTVNISAFARWGEGGPVAGQPSILEIDLSNAVLATAD